MDEDKDLYGGLIRLHILHHAAAKPIFGLWIITELQHHGYRLSPGTLYPILHGLERKGYLVSDLERVGASNRRVYEITALGRIALLAAKKRVWELFGELFEPEGSGSSPAGAGQSKQPPALGRKRRKKRMRETL